MPSILTRHIFRCLISNEHILHTGCLRQQAPGALLRWRQSRQSHIAHRTRVLPVSNREQRRTLFGFTSFSQQNREVVVAGFDPGIEVMMELVKRRRMQARLPELKSVEAAVQAYLVVKSPPGRTPPGKTPPGKAPPSKTDKEEQIPDTHADLLLASYNYILANQPSDQASSDPGQDVRLNVDRLSGWLGTLLAAQKKPVYEGHLALAQRCYNIARRRHPESYCHLELSGLVTILCGLGRTDEALKVLSTYVLEVLNTAPESGDPRNNARALLGLILRTYVDQDNDAGVMAALDTCRSPIGLELAPCFYKVMIKFYALRQDTANLEKWFDSFLQRMALSPSRDSMSRQLRVALTCCLKSKQHELGHRFVRSIMKMDPQKPEWDEILVWGFGLQNSIEEINRMMDVMIQSNQDRPKNAIPHIPDIATINRLVRTAIDAQDPYSAERLIALGKERGIEPDAGTLVLQMQYRLSVKDVDGALIAYKHLQSKDLSSRDDWAVTNQLIVTLCTSGRHDYQTIMNVAADLSDRRAKFEAPTVQALAILHLKRDELQDVQDLIKTHARGFSSAERASLRTTITAFCVDPTTPTANMWDAYNILRHEFDEMPREERTQIMQSCFARTRPDIAVHVFNHMRLHSRLDTMPDDSTYTAAFVGTSKVIADPRQRLPSLRALHNQLKLDTNVRTTTRMLNALMIAYTSCDQGDTALDIWDDILESTEGPTLSSIHIALRACESTDFADVKAQDIWARLRKNNIDLDQKLWASYIAALVGNGNVHNAVTTLEEAYRRDEVELDSLMLGSLYNAAILTGKQGLIASWASAEHNEAWKRLQKVGMATNDYFRASYQVDRWVEP